MTGAPVVKDHFKPPPLWPGPSSHQTARIFLSLQPKKTTPSRVTGEDLMMSPVACTHFTAPVTPSSETKVWSLQPTKMLPLCSAGEDFTWLAE